MKRRIALLLLVLSLLTAFAVPALAYAEPETVVESSEENQTATVSEDLQQVHFADTTYVRCNISRLEGAFSDFPDTTVLLSDTQKQTIEDVGLTVYLYEENTAGAPVAIKVSIYYKDGSVLNIGCLREDLMQTYQTLLETDDCMVDFSYYLDGKQINFPLDAARGTEEILFDIYNYRTFDVIAKDDEPLAVQRGRLLIDNGEYYYVDYNEVGTDNFYTLERFKAWHITDEALCARLDQTMDEYYNSDFGFMENEEFSDDVSGVFLIFLFVALPGACFVLFLILAIRAKTPAYRKLFWNLCAWSAMVLIVAGTLFLVVKLN